MLDLPLDRLLPQDAATFLLNRVAKERHNAGDETAARLLANELGHLPLALEQAAAFIIEVQWTFDKYCEQFREERPELLSHQWEGGTRYPSSVTKTWSVTLERLSPLAREQNSLTADDSKLWIECAAQLFNAFTPESAEDIDTRDIWISVSQHAETLIEHARNHAVDSEPIAILAHEFGQFLHTRAAYTQAEPLTRLALAITEQHLGPNHIHVAIRLTNRAIATQRH
jgi:hypothetical protein